MGAYRGHVEPGKPGKSFALPPELDMGSLKLDDLDFDLEEEVARLRAADAAHPASAGPSLL